MSQSLTNSSDWPVPSLLGPTLLQAGAELPLSAEDAPGDLYLAQYLILYFGASWCVPCRRFAPVFKDCVNNIRNRGEDTVAVVFCSSDKDEESQMDYLEKHMPDGAFAVPLDVVPALDSKFQVSGIPTVVILDAKTGEVIVKDAVTNVLRDPEAKGFPWRARTVWEVLRDDKVVRKNEDGKWVDVQLSELSEKPMSLLLFSAEWAPPCRTFIPILADFYSTLPEPRPPLLLVPSDSEQEVYDRHLDLLPIGSFALAFQTTAEQELSELCQVDDIPALVVIKDSKIATSRGADKVVSDPQGYPWPVISMAEAFEEDDKSMCVLFEEKAGPAEVDAFRQLAMEKMGGTWSFVKVGKTTAANNESTSTEAGVPLPEPEQPTEEDEAITSLRSFLTRQYCLALAHSSKLIAISGDRRSAWGFGWTGGEQGDAELTVAEASSWLEEIDQGGVTGVPPRSLSDDDSAEDSDEDDDDGYWDEEEDTEEYDSEDEADLEQLHSQLQMLMAQMGGAAGLDREQQLRNLLSMLSPGSMGGAGGVDLEELMGGMRAARIEEVCDEDEEVEAESDEEAEGNWVSESEGTDDEEEEEGPQLGKERLEDLKGGDEDNDDPKGKRPIR